MHIESRELTIARTTGDVYDFIKDFRNFQNLMPEQVKNYQADAGHCSFEISSIGPVELEMLERVQDKKIKAVSKGKTAISFALSVNLMPESPETTLAVFQLDADLSPMLALMAKTPLGNFINMMGEKLKEVMESK